MTLIGTCSPKMEQEQGTALEEPPIRSKGRERHSRRQEMPSKGVMLLQNTPTGGRAKMGHVYKGAGLEWGYPH